MNELTPISIDDLYQLGWIEDPRVSPDGRYVAYVRVAVDRVLNRYRRAIWLAPTRPELSRAEGGGPPRQLTSGMASDIAPRWSHDGRRLAFVSDRVEDTPQIWVIDVDGGEAQLVTRALQGASAPAWSPDDRRIAFLGRANEEERAAEDRGEQQPAPVDEWELRRARDLRKHEETQRVDPRVVARLPYRGGTSFYDDRRNHIYLIDAPPAEPDEGADAAPPGPRRLTDGDMHFAAPVWMPDGAAILTTATRDPEADSIFAYYDLLRVPVPEAGRGDPERLTEAGFSYYDPEPSPDGRLIALRRLSEERPMAAGARIAVMPAEGGELRDLTAATDLSVDDRLCWLPGGDGIAFTAGWRGEQAVYRVSLDEETRREAGNTSAPSPGLPVYAAAGRFVEGFDVGPDGSVAFVAGSAANPGELFLHRPDGREIQLTRINERILSQRKLASIEEITYAAPDGREVQGWIVYPPDFEAGEPHPLVVHIHGGPHLMWSPGLRSMWHEFQATAGRGYVVFFCNPRGSNGYGEEWRDAIHANWGEADAADILSGVDAVIARGGIDPARIGVTGGSYGGFMTVWLIGHTDRFACAVSARGVYNLLSEHSTSDAHELIEFEFDGFPWERFELLWRHSPLAYAHNITTPLRILHSEQDYRVPISEAEQLFALLRRRKHVVELVRYPREGHELTRTGEPRHRADHMERTLEWLDRYCKPGG